LTENTFSFTATTWGIVTGERRGESCRIIPYRPGRIQIASVSNDTLSFTLGSVPKITRLPFQGHAIAA
jgi:hypothetical protein